MPTYAEIRTTIRTRFNAPVVGWAAQGRTEPATFSGEEYDPPKGLPWVRLTILGGTRSQVEFGNDRRFRADGVVRVNAFLPAGEGEGLVEDLADAVKNIYEGRTIDGVRFFTTEYTRSGQFEDAWQVFNIDTNYDADELRAV